MGRSQHSYTPDIGTLLHDGAAAVTATGAGQVGGSAKVLDFGNTTAAPLATQIAHTAFDMVVNTTALDFSNSDESYKVILQLSDDTSANGVGFDAGDTVVNKVVVPMGLAGGEANSTADNDSATGRVVVSADNEHKGVLYRYARVFFVLAGTVAGVGFTGQVWLAERHLGGS